MIPAPITRLVIALRGLTGPSLADGWQPWAPFGGGLSMRRRLPDGGFEYREPTEDEASEYLATVSF